MAYVRKSGKSGGVYDFSDSDDSESSDSESSGSSYNPSKIDEALEGVVKELRIVEKSKSEIIILSRYVKKTFESFQSQNENLIELYSDHKFVELRELIQQVRLHVAGDLGHLDEIEKKGLEIL